MWTSYFLSRFIVSLDNFSASCLDLQFYWILLVLPTWIYSFIGYYQYFLPGFIVLLDTISTSYLDLQFYWILLVLPTWIYSCIGYYQYFLPGFIVLLDTINTQVYSVNKQALFSSNPYIYIFILITNNSIVPGTKNTNWVKLSLIIVPAAVHYLVYRIINSSRNFCSLKKRYFYSLIFYFLFSSLKILFMYFRKFLMIDF